MAGLAARAVTPIASVAAFAKEATPTELARDEDCHRRIARSQPQCLILSQLSLIRLAFFPVMAFGNSLLVSGATRKVRAEMPVISASL